MLVVFPPGSTFNMLSVQQVIRTMWHSMMSFPANEPTDLTQQDLTGFFNSVPRDRILQALTYTLFLASGKVEETVAGTSITAFVPQQGLSFSSLSRTSQICGQKHQDYAFGGPTGSDGFHVAIQLLSVWRLHFWTDSRSQ